VFLLSRCKVENTNTGETFCCFGVAVGGVIASNGASTDVKIQLTGADGRVFSNTFEVKSDGSYEKKLFCVPAGQKYKLATFSAGGGESFATPNGGQAFINVGVRIEYDGNSAHHEYGIDAHIGRPGWGNLGVLDVFEDCDFNHFPLN
jgi:hypothetical protein